MTIIYQYVSREMIKSMLIVLVVVVSIYVLIDFFEKIDKFMDAGLPFSKAAIFFGFNVPFIIAQILPVCVLLSVLIVFGLMGRQNEILALKSSGVSVYALVRPVFTIGVAGTILLFFFTEWVVPITSAKANRIWLQEVKQKSAVISKEKNIWIREDREILYIRYYNSAHEAMYGVTLYNFDEDFGLAQRIDAKRGVFQGKRWMLYNVMEQERKPETGTYDVHFLPARYIEFNLLPNDLKTVVKTSEEMNFKELLAYVRKVESEGYDATLYRVDLHAKIAFPFICIILSVVGSGVALRKRMKEGMPASIAYGLGLVFLYWIFYSFCISLGYAGMMPPVAAAWAANLIFFCLGIILLLNAE